MQAVRSFLFIVILLLIVVVAYIVIWNFFLKPASATPTPTQTNTSNVTPSPTTIPTNTPTKPPPPSPSVTLDRLVEFSDPPRVDVTFSAQNMPAAYRPMVVVEDWIGNWFGWKNIDGEGSGTYRLPGITIGTVVQDCGKEFKIYMIMTYEERVAGQIYQLPKGYRTDATVVRQCPG